MLVTEVTQTKKKLPLFLCKHFGHKMDQIEVRYHLQREKKWETIIKAHGEGCRRCKGFIKQLQIPINEGEAVAGVIMLFVESKELV
jgi:hypothetical protein